MTFEAVNDFTAEIEDQPMKNSEAILSTISYLQLPAESYIVIGGGNLVLRGTKDGTPDLDILVPQDVFDWLATVDSAVIKDSVFSPSRQLDENLTVCLSNYLTQVPIKATTKIENGNYPMSFDSHKDQVDLINTIPCLKLEHIIAAKQALGRPKDLDDLAHIEAELTGRPVQLPSDRRRTPISRRLRSALAK